MLQMKYSDIDPPCLVDDRRLNLIETFKDCNRRLKWTLQKAFNLFVKTQLHNLNLLQIKKVGVCTIHKQKR